MSVLIETTLGDIVIDLYTKERPRTCLNFLKLCKTKFYNYNLFFSIEQDFMAQTGDPTNTGRGGSSVFEQVYGEQARYFEMESLPKIRHSKRGLVSMVNNGENLHGSQFFITLADNLDYLDDKHTVFGEIAEGFETLDKLNEALCDDDHRPYRDVWITHTIILDDPFQDPRGLEIPERSPSPSITLLKHTRIGVDEEIDDTAGKTEEQLHEEIESKEAKARAHILEMIGDIHHADERPPDNVLFVCKLNPEVTDEDLAIIFGRFGKILSCEVIRDQKTGNSLQYAFVEFDRVEDCEAAYFKMDNVLINDRRIHVDFSQSVSKNYSWRKQVGATKKKTDTRSGKSGYGNDSKSTRRNDQGRKDARKRSPSRSRSRSPRRERHERKVYWKKEERRRSPSPKYSSSKKYKSGKR